MSRKRCAWAPESDPLYIAYHDEEWGVPSRDDRHLYELLVLEGAQAGLSWSTILHKREGYRRAFAGFEPEAVVRFKPKDMERLLQDTGIVRNRLKVESAVSNARCVLEVQEGREAWPSISGASSAASPLSAGSARSARSRRRRLSRGP